MDVQPPQTATTATGSNPASSGGRVTGTTAAALPVQAQAIDTQSQASRPSTEQVQQAIEKLKQVTQPVAQNLQFSVDDGTGETVIKVVDDRTQELIRQIPSQEFLDMVKSLDKLSGLLLRQKA